KIINIFFILLCLFISQVSAQHKDSKNHSHKSIEAKMPYPSVDIRVIKDAKSGYNIQLITKNFKLNIIKIAIILISTLITFYFLYNIWTRSSIANSGRELSIPIWEHLYRIT
ncbi:MAG: hypothetical protein ACKPKO_60550, partial [Candidatus Fonsibacter sp.]